MLDCEFLNNWYTSPEASIIPEALDRSWECVTLPHLWEAGKSFSELNLRPRIYACNFRLEDKAEDCFYYLHIRSAAHSATVYINNRKAGTHQGALTQMCFDITPYVKKDFDNYAVIVVDNSYHEGVLPQDLSKLKQLGLLDEVWLEICGRSHLRRDICGSTGVFFSSDFSPEGLRLCFTAMVRNPKEGQRLRFLLTSPSGETLLETSAAAKPELSLCIPPEEYQLWEPGLADSHYLLSCCLMEGEKILDRFTTPVGIRKVSCADSSLYVNGEALQLTGQDFSDDRRSALYPYDIGSVKKRELMYRFNWNLIDLPYAAYNAERLETAAAEGRILAPGLPLTGPLGSDVSSLDAAREELKEIIYQYYNSPSVLYWTLGRELPDPLQNTLLYEQLHSLRMLSGQLDPKRPAALSLNEVPAADERLREIADIFIFRPKRGLSPAEVSAFFKRIEALHEAMPRLILGADLGDDCECGLSPAEEEAADACVLDAAVSCPALSILIFSPAKLSGDPAASPERDFMTEPLPVVRKDLFHLLNACYGREDNVHISRRSLPAQAGPADVVLYSSLPEAELFLNDESRGPVRADTRFVIPGVMFRPGANHLLAIAGEASDNFWYWLEEEKSSEQSAAGKAASEPASSSAPEPAEAAEAEAAAGSAPAKESTSISDAALAAEAEEKAETAETSEEDKETASEKAENAED